MVFSWRVAACLGSVVGFSPAGGVWMQRPAVGISFLGSLPSQKLGAAEDDRGAWGFYFEDVGPGGFELGAVLERNRVVQVEDHWAFECAGLFAERFEFRGPGFGPVAECGDGVIGREGRGEAGGGDEGGEEFGEEGFHGEAPGRDSGFGRGLGRCGSLGSGDFWWILSHLVGMTLGLVW